MNVEPTLFSLISDRYDSSAIIASQVTADRILTVWVREERLKELLRFLKYDISGPFRMLYDLTAVDERRRSPGRIQPEADFTLVYHLTSFDRNEDIRIKVPLKGEYPSAVSITDIWPAANWYEREAWDMFGVTFNNHPDLRRILMPPTWQGHPLRKEHPARATDMPPFALPDWKEEIEQNALEFHPEDWGLHRRSQDSEFMFLNVGPQHPGTHGVLRLVLQLDAEQIVDVVPDIGFHHRGAEKMGERQSWHTFIPYTDRIDYLGGVINNLAYVLSVEKIAGITLRQGRKRSGSIQRLEYSPVICMISRAVNQLLIDNFAGSGNCDIHDHIPDPLSFNSFIDPPFFVDVLQHGEIIGPYISAKGFPFAQTTEKAPGNA